MEDIGINWHLRFRMEIEVLKNEKMILELENLSLRHKLLQYENDNTRTTRNGEDNNVIKFSR